MVNGSALELLLLWLLLSLTHAMEQDYADRRGEAEEGRAPLELPDVRRVIENHPFPLRSQAHADHWQQDQPGRQGDIHVYEQIRSSAAFVPHVPLAAGAFGSVVGPMVSYIPKIHNIASGTAAGFGTAISTGIFLGNAVHGSMNNAGAEVAAAQAKELANVEATGAAMTADTDRVIAQYQAAYNRRMLNQPPNPVLMAQAQNEANAEIKASLDPWNIIDPLNDNQDLAKPYREQDLAPSRRLPGLKVINATSNSNFGISNKRLRVDRFQQSFGNQYLEAKGALDPYTHNKRIEAQIIANMATQQDNSRRAHEAGFTNYLPGANPNPRQAPPEDEDRRYRRIRPPPNPPAIPTMPAPPERDRTPEEIERERLRVPEVHQPIPPRGGWGRDDAPDGSQKWYHLPNGQSYFGPFPPRDESRPSSPSEGPAHTDSTYGSYHTPSSTYEDSHHSFPSTDHTRTPSPKEPARTPSLQESSTSSTSNTDDDMSRRLQHYREILAPFAPNSGRGGSQTLESRAGEQGTSQLSRIPSSLPSIPSHDRQTTRLQKPELSPILTNVPLTSLGQPRSNTSSASSSSDGDLSDYHSAIQTPITTSYGNSPHSPQAPWSTISHSSDQTSSGALDKPGMPMVQPLEPVGSPRIQSTRHSPLSNAAPALPQGRSSSLPASTSPNATEVAGAHHEVESPNLPLQQHAPLRGLEPSTSSAPSLPPMRESRLPLAISSSPTTSQSIQHGTESPSPGPHSVTSSGGHSSTPSPTPHLQADTSDVSTLTGPPSPGVSTSTRDKIDFPSSPSHTATHVGEKSPPTATGPPSPAHTSGSQKSSPSETTSSQLHFPSLGRVISLQAGQGSVGTVGLLTESTRRNMLRGPLSPSITASGNRIASPSETEGAHRSSSSSLSPSPPPATSHESERHVQEKAHTQIQSPAITTPSPSPPTPTRSVSLASGTEKKADTHNATSASLIAEHLPPPPSPTRAAPVMSGTEQKTSTISSGVKPPQPPPQNQGSAKPATKPDVKAPQVKAAATSSTASSSSETKATGTVIPPPPAKPEVKAQSTSTSVTSSPSTTSVTSSSSNVSRAATATGQQPSSATAVATPAAVVKSTPTAMSSVAKSTPAVPKAVGKG